MHFLETGRCLLGGLLGHPVNLMDYVTHVFQKVFGWSQERAHRHMLEVHEQGKSILMRESLEKAEHYVHQLQCYHLQATLEKDA